MQNHAVVTTIPEFLFGFELHFFLLLVLCLSVLYSVRSFVAHDFSSFCIFARNKCKTARKINADVFPVYET